MKQENGKYTKEDIKTRMLNRMQAIWDVRSMSLADPTMRLLVEALAMEVFRITGELSSAQTRMLERLAAMMTPSSMLTASPATAVLHARTSEGESYITPDAVFTSRDEQLSRRYNLKHFTFHPLCCMKSVDAEVRYIADSRALYEVLPGMGKDIHAQARQRMPEMNNTVYLGIAPGRAVQSFEDVSFWFDMPGIEDAAQFLSMLSYARWSVGRKEIAVKLGFNERLYDRFGISQKFRTLNADRINRMGRSFVTITEDLRPAQLVGGGLPPEIEHCYGEYLAQAVSEPLVWIKIAFPGKFTQEVLGRLVVHMNAIPIVNMDKHRLSGRIDAFSSVVPLRKQSAEYLLCVDSVTDENGSIYRESGFGDVSASVAGSYSVRHGGCERSGTEDMRDLIVRLTDSLYEESFSLSGSDKENMLENLSDLLRQAESLTRSLTPEERMQESTSYLIVDTRLAESRRLSVEYWMTNGHILNDLAVGGLFRCPQESAIEKSSVRLLTPLLGGKPSPDISRKTDIYKYLLLSRDAIYTREDIENYCRAFYGEYIRQVSVSLTYRPGNRPGQGIVRVLEVTIIPGEGMAGIDTEQFRCDLLSDLERRSPSTFNYSIQIKNE